MPEGRTRIPICGGKNDLIRGFVPVGTDEFVYLVGGKILSPGKTFDRDGYQKFIDLKVGIFLFESSSTIY